ncbi:MAG: hypothetical protein ACRD82_02075, partial [Blastocatellia bacterium]
MTFLLVILLAIPQPLLAQMLAQTRRPAQHQKTRQADSIAVAISDLLKEHPFVSIPDDEEDRGVNSDDSEENEKPPADDAPIEKLIAYWSNHAFSDFAEDDDQKPSDKVRERLLEVFENRPWLSPTLPGLLPETSNAYDRLYKLLNEDQDDQSNWKNVIRLKLKHNSSYFRDELVNDVRNVGKSNYPDHASLLALVKLDWYAARPFVEQMAGSPIPERSLQGLTILYEQACRANDSSQAESLRAQLKAFAANPQTGGARHNVLQSLMETEWNGRDEWYVSLFADTSLSGVQVEEKVEEKAGDKEPPVKRNLPNREMPNREMEDFAEDFLSFPLLNNPTR